jgi:microsomal dipeptidase-like Zn-dependent dipeptidase
MKKYKYKEYKEKNTADSPKLSKRVKRAIEGSNRIKAKKEALQGIEIEGEVLDEWEDAELRLAGLCWQAEQLIGDSYKCTCPAGGELAVQHTTYLTELINKHTIEEVKKLELKNSFALFLADFKAKDSR